MIIKSILAFGAGFISFLTPCVLPIIPGYISYISGKPLPELEKNKNVVLLKTIIFSLGFSLVFITLGAAASAVGNVLLFFSNELRIVAGILIILFALNFLGLLNFNFLNTQKRFDTGDYKDNLIFPLIVGGAFAFGWTLYRTNFRINHYSICDGVDYFKRDNFINFLLSRPSNTIHSIRLFHNNFY